jgi:protein TonB
MLLHLALLFFVQLAPPSWKAYSGSSNPLKVRLDSTLTNIAKPTAIAEASQNDQGSEKTGAQSTQLSAAKPLTATTAFLSEHNRTSIPENITGRKLLTATKSAQVKVAESTPDLLVTSAPLAENPEDKDKPYAPMPSVAKPEAVAATPVENLVSAAPLAGEKQEKIVFTEPVQATPPLEKSGNRLEEPKPVKIEVPKPVELAKVTPVEIEKPKPVVIEEPKPIKIAETAPVRVAESAPAKTDEPKSVKTGGSPEPVARSLQAGQAELFRPGTPAFKIPSLAELNIASVKKFASDEGRKIKFGERRKVIGVREQDFRYAMYVESVRLKLQRIGMFNYPLAAAKDNISGALTVLITLRADGSLEEFSVIQPSAYQVLNEGAERIVKMSAPFSPLPDNIRQDTDVLSIKINWTFSKSSQSFD